MLLASTYSVLHPADVNYSERTPQHIENQTQYERHEQHRGERNVDARALVAELKIARQPPEPRQRAGHHQQPDDDRAQSEDDHH